MPRGPKGPDIRDCEPTIAILDARIYFNGGTLSADPVGHVWRGVLEAFEKVARANGMRCSWMGELKCMQPKRMDRMIERLQLQIVEPPSAAAVDPVGEQVTE